MKKQLSGGLEPTKYHEGAKDARPSARIVSSCWVNLFFILFLSILSLQCEPEAQEYPNWRVLNANEMKLNDSNIILIISEGTNKSWIFSRNEIVQYSDNQWNLFYEFESNEHVTSGVQFANFLYLGTQNGLVIINLSDSSIERFNEQNSNLSSNYVNDVEVELLNDSLIIWIATIYGLNRFTGQNWTVYNESNSGLMDNEITSIDIGGSGDLWVSVFSVVNTNENSFALYDRSNNNWTSFTEQSIGQQISYCQDIEVGPNGDMWALGFGLHHYSNNLWEDYNVSNTSLPLKSMSCLNLNTDGSLYVGTLGYGITTLKNLEGTTFNSSNSGLPNNSVTSIGQHSHEEILIGTINGLAIYKPHNQ